jgi:hypothetical protein
VSKKLPKSTSSLARHTRERGPLDEWVGDLTPGAAGEPRVALIAPLYVEVFWISYELVPVSAGVRAAA